MIDIHTYPVLVKEMVEESAEMMRATRDVFQCGNNLQPLEVFHLQMDAGNIDTAVILPIACQRLRDVDVFTNEQIAELLGRSDRLIGFASVDPGTGPEAAEKLKSDVEKFGLKGVHLLPAMQEFDPYSRDAYAVYETARGLGIPIMIETGMSWAPGVPLAPGRPLNYEKLIGDFPGHPIILTHLGWPWVSETVALMLKYEWVYTDTSALYHDHPLEFGQFVFNQMVPKTVIERSLRERVLLGSGYPRMEIKQAVELLKGARLNPDAIEQIGENAYHLLGLK